MSLCCRCDNPLERFESWNGGIRYRCVNNKCKGERRKI